MKSLVRITLMSVALALGAGSVWAKLPEPSEEAKAKAAEAKVKADEAAKKAAEELAAAQDRVAAAWKAQSAAK